MSFTLIVHRHNKEVSPPPAVASVLTGEPTREELDALREALGPSVEIVTCADGDPLIPTVTIMGRDMQVALFTDTPASARRLCFSALIGWAPTLLGLVDETSHVVATPALAAAAIEDAAAEVAAGDGLSEVLLSVLEGGGIIAAGDWTNEGFAQDVVIGTATLRVYDQASHRLAAALAQLATTVQAGVAGT